MQINYLKEKLEKVEERQEKMVKFENNPSKMSKIIVFVSLYDEEIFFLKVSKCPEHSPEVSKI